MIRVDGPVPLLRSERLAALQGIGHAVTTRAGGVSTGFRASLNLGDRPGETDANLGVNRQRAVAAAGAPPDLVLLRQVCGSEVLRAGRSGETGDALWTGHPGRTLLTLSADCCLVLLADPVRRRVASVHASRAGARGNIAGRAVAALGSDPANLVALVGPSIGPCCHELHGPVLEDWRAHAPSRMDGTRLDLKGVVRDQLAAAGVRAVDSWDLCTKCRADLFFSHRRDGEGAGRFGALIWLE